MFFVVQLLQVAGEGKEGKETKESKQGVDTAKRVGPIPEQNNTRLALIGTLCVHFKELLGTYCRTHRGRAFTEMLCEKRVKHGFHRGSPRKAIAGQRSVLRRVQFAIHRRLLHDGNDRLGELLLLGQQFKNVLIRRLSFIEIFQRFHHKPVGHLFFRKLGDVGKYLDVSLFRRQ